MAFGAHARRLPVAAGLWAALIALAGGTTAAGPQEAAEQATLAGRPVRLDVTGRLESWIAPQAEAYDTVLDRAWNRLLTGFGMEANGLPTYLAYCCFDATTLKGTWWP